MSRARRRQVSSELKAKEDECDKALAALTDLLREL